MTLSEWYRHNADATGHADTCRRREVDMTQHRALDPERCERCQFLSDRLGTWGEGWKIAR